LHASNVADAHIHAATSVAIHKFSLTTGFSFSDCLLYVNGETQGVIDVKKAESTLTAAGLQGACYSQRFSEQFVFFSKSVASCSSSAQLKRRSTTTDSPWRALR
jgi:hypothetical protein